MKQAAPSAPKDHLSESGAPKQKTKKQKPKRTKKPPIVLEPFQRTGLPRLRGACFRFSGAGAGARPSTRRKRKTPTQDGCVSVGVRARFVGTLLNVGAKGKPKGPPNMGRPRLFWHTQTHTHTNEYASKRRMGPYKCCVFRLPFKPKVKRTCFRLNSSWARLTRLTWRPLRGQAKETQRGEGTNGLVHSEPNSCGFLLVSL